MFHMNISSLPKHFDELTSLLENLQHTFKILAFSETRLTVTYEYFCNLEIPNYSLYANKTDSTAGGTALYIHNDIEHKLRSDLSSKMYKSKELESTFVEISLKNQKNMIIGCIYRHPNMSMDEFKTMMLSFLDNINQENKNISLLGDFNINLLNEDSPQVNHFVDILKSNLIFPTITLPTRVTTTSQTLIDTRVTTTSQTLIDNILISPTNTKTIKSGNLTIGISDHLPQFIVFNNPTVSKNIQIKSYQDWKNFDTKGFGREFRSTNWGPILALNDPYKSFKRFHELLNDLITIFVPVKQLSKNRQKINNQLWMTKGILKAISKKNKVFKKFVKAVDPTIKTIYQERYKNHCNQIVTLIRQSKLNKTALWL